MKHLLAALFLITLTIGCGAKKQPIQLVYLSERAPIPAEKVAPEPEPEQESEPAPEQKVEAEQLFFDGRTDAELLSDALQGTGTQQPGFHSFGIPKNSSISIGSLERMPDTTSSHYYTRNQVDEKSLLVEDGLTILLLKTGYKVAERDLDVMARLYHESLEKYLVSIGPDFKPNEFYDELISHLKAEKSIAGSGGERGVSTNYVAKKVVDTFLPTFNFKNDPYIFHPFAGEKTLQEKHTIESSDYLLSYRILECGVKINGSKELFKGRYEAVERIAKIRLHLRLVNTKTGNIEWSDNITGTASEVTAEILIGEATSAAYKIDDSPDEERIQKAKERVEELNEQKETAKPEEPQQPKDSKSQES